MQGVRGWYKAGLQLILIRALRPFYNLGVMFILTALLLGRAPDWGSGDGLMPQSTVAAIGLYHGPLVGTPDIPSL